MYSLADEQKQLTVATSSCEVEHRVAFIATVECICLRRLLDELGVGHHCHYYLVLAIAQNPMFHACTKHIEVHYHYVREKVLAHEIDLVYVRAHKQVVDIFTKSLGAKKM